jgi:Tfp pilus assembly protein PilX
MRNLNRSGDRLAVRLPARLKNEQGAALILAMVILVMLTFIGLAALSTSSTELFLSGNYRQSREAFQMADGLTEAALKDTDNFIPPTGGVGGVTALTAGTLSDTDPSNNSTATATGTITYVTTGAAQAGSGMTVVMGSSVKANYFIVDTTGEGSLGHQSQQQLVMSEIVPGG